MLKLIGDDLKGVWDEFSTLGYDFFAWQSHARPYLELKAGPEFHTVSLGLATVSIIIALYLMSLSQSS